MASEFRSIGVDNPVQAQCSLLRNRKHNILGVLIDATDYDATVEEISRAARKRLGFTVSAAAVHTIIEGALDPEHKYRLNTFDLVVPDGQPVRWALNLLHGARLPLCVWGVELTLRLCARAEQEQLGVFFYGNTDEVLFSLRNNLINRFPNLHIVGMEASQFRRLSPEERHCVSERILQSGASICLVGLGCPRQDVWAYEYKQALAMPIVAVGGAFGVLSGKVPRAPAWMQQRGLEWLFRLILEPRRLWRRYVLLSPAYVALLALQAIGVKQFTTDGKQPAVDESYG